MYVPYSELIPETEAELLDQERHTPNPKVAARLRMLRLLKSGQAHNLSSCAVLLGYSEGYVERLWRTYRYEGLQALLRVQSPPGKVSRTPPEAWAGVEEQCRQGKIACMEDARRYLKDQWQIEYPSINGVWWLFKTHKIKLKTGRRRHQKADEEAQEAFKQTSERA